MDVSISRKKQMKRSRRALWERGEKRLIIVCAVFVVVFGALGLRWHQATAEPRVSLPEPTLPSPNAYAFFVAAGNAIARHKAIDNVTRPGSAPKEETSLAEKQKAVQANREALRILRQGFAYPYHEPPARSSAQLFPHYAKYREMARLLALEAQVKAEADGNAAGAVSSSLDSIQMGTQSVRGGVLITALVGYACQSIGRYVAWEYVNGLTSEEARDAARRLERLQSSAVPFADVLQEEKWFGQAALLEVFRSPNGLKMMQGTATDDEDASSGTGALLNLMYLRWPKKTILENHARYMDALAERARLPYAEAERSAPIPLPDDLLNKILLPVFDTARFTEASCNAQNALLMTALALQAYREAHGSYPAMLDELEKGPSPILNKVPTDPFAPGKAPLRYRRDGGKYLLYSVGPDLTDDGGEAIYDKSRAEHQRRAIQPDSKGDIVAGVNP